METTPAQTTPTRPNEKTSARHIAAVLKANGHEAYFAGGCVRDRLLGKEPKDFDITTSAKPEEVSAIFENSDQVGAHFGVVIAKHEGTAVEIATFRTDGSYSDGRRPDQVEYATAAEDAFRRDFTINGLFEDPETGEIIDHVGGQADLEKKLLRAIGNPEDRFNEDSLRLLRAVRFATRLGFTIEEQTLEAIKNNASGLDRVSAERVRDEFSRIITDPNRLRGIQLLQETGLLDRFMPELATLDGCDQSPEHHPEGDVMTHTLMMMEALPENASLELALGTLLHDIGKPATWNKLESGRITFHGHEDAGIPIAREILERLKYPTKTIETVCALVEKHMKPHSALEMRGATVRRMLGWEHSEMLLELHKIDCICSNGKLETYNFLIETQKQLGSEPALPPRLVTGKDLISRGLTPGPAFREILDNAQTEQLEGRMPDRESAIAWLDANIKKEKEAPVL